jgi:hypothetical protein
MGTHFRQETKESGSFLKKRTKKLLPVGARTAVHAPMDKSFLVLFFKKEPLSCFLSPFL